MMHYKLTYILLISGFILLGCSESAENEEVVETVEINNTSVLVKDTTNFFALEVFLDLLDQSDYDYLGLHSKVKQIKEFDSERHGYYMMYFDESGRIYKTNEINKEGKQIEITRETFDDSSLVNYNSQGNPISISYFPNGKNDMWNVCTYYLANYTSKTDYLNSQGGLVMEEVIRYNSSGQQIEYQKTDVNRDVWIEAYAYDSLGNIACSYSIDGNHGDTLSITNYKYRFDKFFNWTKKTIVSENDRRVYRRQIKYY